MGRAIVRDPDVFLFDEPLSNFDANLRVQMRAEIKSLHQRLGSTIDCVTHDQIEAMTMADRIVVMRGGIVEQTGTPLEPYDNPANIFVAGFLGSPSMNFIPSRLSQGGTPALVLSDQSKIALSACPKQSEGQEVVLGGRPQDIVEEPASGAPATIKVIEPTGIDTHLLAELAGNTLTCVLPSRLDKAVGDEIRLSFAMPNTHFFDPKSAQRIG